MEHSKLPRVLVVDDEALIRLAVGDFLEMAGFKVVEAASGDEAARFLEKGGKVDLVFSDVRMPGSLDGFQLAAWIHDRHPSLPVFLASGDIGKAQSTFQISAGQPFFLKPYSIDAVVKRMRSTLDGLAQAARSKPGAVIAA